MRKRAQRRSLVVDEKKPAIPKKVERKPTFTFTKRKDWWIAVALIGIFFMVLFLNSYYNITSDFAINPEGQTLSEKFYLSGPDPYYNMRLVEETIETGRYPYYVEVDPLLNYPVGRSGGRPPLLNMMAIGFSKLLQPFMSEIDAVGYSMQFIPALFGALIILPVYLIGKTLFGRKEGLIAAFFIAIIPIHIGSGHGSAYSLFDHDSFNLLLFFLTFLFIIYSIKERDRIKSILYALLAGIPMAALTMTWVEARFIYVLIALYIVVQMVIDIYTNKIDYSVPTTGAVALLTGYLVSLPVRMAKLGGFKPELTIFLALGVIAFGLIYVFVDKRKIPWVISLPTIFILGGILLVVLYFINDISAAVPALSPLSKISEIIFGSGIYGNKVHDTIAEAGTYSISRSVMSYGPVIYWLAWAGFIFIAVQYYRLKGRRDYLFIIILFLVNIWLASTAGRFLNDFVPLAAILAGWIVWFLIDKINYRQMLRNIRNAGGGFRGIRKGMRVFHLLGILFVAFVVIMPNALLALDAAIPSAVTKNGTSNMKIDYFGEDYTGAFGSSSYKEQYWVEAFSWLNDQDTEFSDDFDKPGIISWWDYGFYESAVGGHPTVADNFQDGIPPAANFHTSTSEKEAVSVWIVRILEGFLRHHNNEFSSEILQTLEDHIGMNNTENLITWIQNPTLSPSYNTQIGVEYDEELSSQLLVGEQYYENGYYHDITQLINDTLDDEGVTWLYHDLQEATGYSIRYYGVEGYDTAIFNIFGFLADKSLVLSALREGGGEKIYNPEDDFIQILFVGYKANPDGSKGADGEWTADEINAMSDDERKYIVITDTKSEYKPAYFNSTFYRTYVGNFPEQLQSQGLRQFPCWDMRHFTAEFISELPYYGTGRSAVVIAKYYEGAFVSGIVEYLGKPLDAEVVITKDINLYGNAFPIDHDRAQTENGTFRLLSPAGNISVEIRRNPELGVNAFVIKRIIFNSTDDPMFAPISDDEAMRTTGTNYQRSINVTVKPGVLKGFVYDNMDNLSQFNASKDQPLGNVDISIMEIAEFDANTGQPTGFGAFRDVTTDDNGYYSISELMPGYYIVRATQNDFVIHEEYTLIFEGNNSYNILKPQPGKITGTIYFDSNDNTIYDKGEEMNNVKTELLYNKIDGTTKSVDLHITDTSGTFSFTDLIPGNYVINATKINTDTGYNDYATEEIITITENQTTQLNISIAYAPISVQGYTKHQGENIGEISIRFLIDETVVNNTAQQITTQSDENGLYTANLMPGTYNVTVDERGQKGTYTFEGHLFLKMGQGTATYDLSLIKHSVTVTGYTKYGTDNIDNITIRFQPDVNVLNNTAQYSSVKSDKLGFYTAELMPGNYNVSILEKTETVDDINVTYSYTGYLIIRDEETMVTEDILLTRVQTE